ncbi:histone-lysine N-methyltransferase SETMAR [Trichonephila clavipes]|nr:histone-lysine N-methyltransferase SETMAR [Trichonephila clavipes]
MKLIREHYRAVSFYDFKAGLKQEEGFQQLKLAFCDESPCRVTVFRGFNKFCSGRYSLQNEEHTGRPRSVVIPDNVSTIRKILMDDNCCTYQMLQKELNIGSSAMYKIIREELHMIKVVCRWVPHNLTEHQKEESVSELVKKPLNC